MRCYDQLWFGHLFFFGSIGFNFLLLMGLGADALLERRKSGKCKKYLCKLENKDKSISFSVKPNFESDIKNIVNRLLHFHARQMDQRLGFSVTESVLILKFGECEPFFFRFEKYLYIVCLKIAHLGRVTYCFETLLFLCKLVFFNYNFHKNTRSRQKRFVSKQGQPRPQTQLKARLLTEQLKNGLFLRLHYSVHYYRLANLPIVILTMFVKYVFPSQICAIPR